MRVSSIEELYVRKIENGIRGIKMGTKRPFEVNINTELARLSTINPHLFDELSVKYSSVLTEFEKKKVNNLFR